MDCKKKCFFVANRPCKVYKRKRRVEESRISSCRGVLWLPSAVSWGFRLLFQLPASSKVVSAQWPLQSVPMYIQWPSFLARQQKKQSMAGRIPDYSRLEISFQSHVSFISVTRCFSPVRDPRLHALYVFRMASIHVWKLHPPPCVRMLPWWHSFTKSIRNWRMDQKFSAEKQHYSQVEKKMGQTVSLYYQRLPQAQGESCRHLWFGWSHVAFVARQDESSQCTTSSNSAAAEIQLSD